MKRANKLIFKTLIVGIFLCLAIGFAVLTSNLNINGLFLFSSNSWDIHFENAFVDPNSTVVDIPKIDNTKNSISFTATLSKPTDNYTFYVNVVNNSTVDAMFNSMSITGLEDVTDYVTSTVTYENGTSLNQNDILYKDFSTCLKVSIVYKDITIEQIPRENITVTATMTFNYKQANSDAKLVAGTNQVNFDFSGTEDTYVVPYNGVYQLEVWGAQGGGYGEYYGGYGAYAVGSINLNKEQNVYINVGGAGLDGYINETIYSGGYNGGGNAHRAPAEFRGIGTGGGATHIALSSGLLKSLESKKSDILIVASGGGAGANPYFGENNYYYAFGGHGGGITGGSSNGFSGFHSSDNWSPCQGGSQEVASSRPGGESTNPAALGSFGQGGFYTLSDAENYSSSGGGGGYYGGDGCRNFGGGGGSSYIGNKLLENKTMYCFNCIESQSVDTKTVSVDTVSDKAISKYAKIGNGYARISLVSKN